MGELISLVLLIVMEVLLFTYWRLFCSTTHCKWLCFVFTWCITTFFHQRSNKYSRISVIRLSATPARPPPPVIRYSENAGPAAIRSKIHKLIDQKNFLQFILIVKSLHQLQGMADRHFTTITAVLHTTITYYMSAVWSCNNCQLQMLQIITTNLIYLKFWEH